MPIHDWTKVEAGIFHHFHGLWIQGIALTLNEGVLPAGCYALSEQRALGAMRDVLTFHEDPPSGGTADGGGLLLAPPKTRVVEQTDAAFYLRKQNIITVRRADDDSPVAVIEVVSPGNKNSKNPFEAFVRKAVELLTRNIHLLILDLHPPGKWDPNGMHAAIWDEVGENSHTQPTDKPLTAAAYECGDGPTADVEPVAVGDALPDMPLFLVPGGHVLVPLEKTYQTAWQGVPVRWRRVIEAAPASGG